MVAIQDDDVMVLYAHDDGNDVDLDIDDGCDNDDGGQKSCR